MRKCKKCRQKYTNDILNCPTCGQDLRYPEGNNIGILALSLLIISAIMFYLSVYYHYNKYFDSNIIRTIIIIIGKVRIWVTLIGMIISIIAFIKYNRNKYCKISFWYIFIMFIVRYIVIFVEMGYI